MLNEAMVLVGKVAEYIALGCASSLGILFVILTGHFLYERVKQTLLIYRKTE